MICSLDSPKDELGRKPTHHRGLTAKNYLTEYRTIHIGAARQSGKTAAVAALAEKYLKNKKEVMVFVRNFTIPKILIKRYPFLNGKVYYNLHHLFRGRGVIDLAIINGDSQDTPKIIDELANHGCDLLVIMH